MDRDEITVTVAAAIQNGTEVLANAVKERRWMENNWLQADIAERLSLDKPDRVVERERPYPTTQERCDVWVKDGGGRETWMELKCCVTNYMRGPTDETTARPITQQIDEIIRDIEKLKALGNDEDRRIVFLAYPLPRGYKSHGHWVRHLARLKAAGAEVQEVTSVPVDAQNALIVAYECRV